MRRPLLHAPNGSLPLSARGCVPVAAVRCMFNSIVDLSYLLARTDRLDVPGDATVRPVAEVADGTAIDSI